MPRYNFIYRLDLLQPALGFFGLLTLCVLLLCNPVSQAATAATPYKVYVHAGLIEETIEYLQSLNYWNSTSHHDAKDAPRIIIVASSAHWEQHSSKVPVEVKKELFYRAITPMVLYSNELILKDRQEIGLLSKKLDKGETLSAKEIEYLKIKLTEYGLDETPQTKPQLDLLLDRVDIIPPSLALGQTAYESGYGTSRFALEGNALFGQWTYSGKGMKPKEHRASKGNYGVAAYKWPFDSVRSYMQNINSHNAYQALRDKRAELRKQGKDITGLDLAETLVNYSEKGEEYVKTLKSIITSNDLEISDQTVLRDEPVTLIIGVDKVEDVGKSEEEIEKLRKSGELDRIIKEMRLDLHE